MTFLEQQNKKTELPTVLVLFIFAETFLNELNTLNVRKDSEEDELCIFNGYFQKKCPPLFMEAALLWSKRFSATSRRCRKSLSSWQLEFVGGGGGRG